jgi:hypothetical protein
MNDTDIVFLLLSFVVLLLLWSNVRLWWKLKDKEELLEWYKVEYDGLMGEMNKVWFENRMLEAEIAQLNTRNEPSSGGANT